MKKLKILLFFLGIAMISTSASSDDRPDYGKIWNAWGIEGQTAYMYGFVDGESHTLLTVGNEIISSSKRGGKVLQNFYENIRTKTATLYDADKIINVMTNLYKDPANSYILFEDMVYIARDSLSGEDVTKAILDARKNAIATYELNKKFKNK